MNLFRFMLLLIVLFFNTTIYAQDWVSYNPYQYVPVQTNVVTSYVYQPQPTLVYQYVPYVVNQPILLEQRCLLFKTQKVTYVPQVQYIYQPIIVYK